MKFIEDHAPHPSQRGVALQAPQEEPVGDHLHLGAAGSLLFPAHGITDARTDVFSKACSKAGGGSFGGQPPRLDHPDFLMLVKNALTFRQRPDQCQGDPCGLSCPGRCLEQNCLAWADRRTDLLQQGVDRELAQRGVAARFTG